MQNYNVVDELETALYTAADYNAFVYRVTLSWFTDEKDYPDRGDVFYTFSNAEDAVNFAYNIAHTTLAYSFSQPYDIYIYRDPVRSITLKDGSIVNAVESDEDQSYVAAYYHVDQNVKFDY